jgi:hypothetical protein
METPVLRTPEPLIAREPTDIACQPVDDFLTCEPNLNSLHWILGFTSSCRTSEGLAHANKKKRSKSLDQRVKMRMRRQIMVEMIR